MLYLVRSMIMFHKISVKINKIKLKKMSDFRVFYQVCNKLLTR